MNALKTGDIYAHTQTVCIRPFLRGEGPGDEARLGFEQHMENGTERAERCMVDCLLLMEVIHNNHDW